MTLSLKIYQSFIKKVKIFEFAEDKFIREICKDLVPNLCMSGDWIYKEKEIAE